MKSLYDVLGARENDDADALKKAFRRAIKANHPDLHPGDPDAPERFKKIIAAHALLRDAKQRVIYDRMLQLERQQFFQLKVKSKLARQPLRLKRMPATAAIAAIGALVGGYGLFSLMSTTTIIVAINKDDPAATAIVVAKRNEDTSTATAAPKADAVKGNAEGNVDNAGKRVETTGAQVMEPNRGQPRDKHDGTEVANGESKLNAEKLEDAKVPNEANKLSDDAAAIMRFVMQRLRDGGDAQATAGRELALGPPAGATPDRDEVAALLARAHTYLTAGDVAAARLVLRRAAERDDPHAALALGGTYDPTVLKRLGIVNFQTDPALAGEWYRRAAQLGSADASLRLEQLVQTGTINSKKENDRPPPRAGGLLTPRPRP